MATKDMTITEAAQAAAADNGPPCSEWTLRRLDTKKIISPARDPWGRRIFRPGDVAEARKYLEGKRTSAVA